MVQTSHFLKRNAWFQQTEARTRIWHEGPRKIRKIFPEEMISQNENAGATPVCPTSFPAIYYESKYIVHSFNLKSRNLQWRYSLGNPPPSIYKWITATFHNYLEKSMINEKYHLEDTVYINTLKFYFHLFIMLYIYFKQFRGIIVRNVIVSVVHAYKGISITLERQTFCAGDMW